MFVGMDSHKDTLAISGVDAAGRQQQTQVFPNTVQVAPLLAERAQPMLAAPPPKTSNDQNLWMVVGG